MIERDKEYYNQKISELYAVIENQEKIIRDLQERNSKAIEYVEEHRIKNPYHYEYNCFMGNARTSDLLEILKGGNNEKGSKR